MQAARRRRGESVSDGICIRRRSPRSTEVQRRPRTLGSRGRGNQGAVAVTVRIRCGRVGLRRRPIGATVGRSTIHSSGSRRPGRAVTGAIVLLIGITESLRCMVGRDINRAVNAERQRSFRINDGWPTTRQQNPQNSSRRASACAGLPRPSQLQPRHQSIAPRAVVPPIAAASRPIEVGPLRLIICDCTGTVDPSAERQIRDL